jgi:hypothetical protein
MLRAPAHTTATLDRVNWIRSGETSIDVSAPRCTPPIPAEQKNFSPASCAAITDDATVVAPIPPRASTIGRSRLLTSGMFRAEANRSMSVSPMPTRIRPLSMPMVAGTEPPARTASSTRRAVSALSG